MESKTAAEPGPKKEITYQVARITHYVLMRFHSEDDGNGLVSGGIEKIGEFDTEEKAEAIRCLLEPTRPVSLTSGDVT